jgi:hypothetical protein
VSLLASRIARLALVALAIALASAAFARVGVGALFTATPREMVFVPDPAHAERPP